MTAYDQYIRASGAIDGVGGLSKPRVLVLGGGGFLGTHLCNHLKAAGHIVTAFDRSFSPSLYPQVERISGDFTIISEVKRALQGKDFVFHLIHGTNPPMVNSDIRGDLERTVQPTISLLEECVAENIKRVVYLSSGGTVYGDNGMVASRESDPTIPVSAYGAHKLLIENYLRVFATSLHLDYLIIRLSNPYGPLQPIGKGVGLIVALIDALRNGRTIDIFGDGENLRDYIYVTDAIRAIVRSMTYSGRHKVFNIGSGEGKSINEIVQLLEVTMGAKLKKNVLPARSFDVRKSILDISLAKNELGWHPNTDIHDGIKQTLINL